MKLEIGEQIPDKRNLLDTYLLRTVSEHGEKGATSTHSLQFPADKKEDLLKYFEFLSHFANKDMSNGKEVTNFANKLATNLNMSKKGSEIVTNIIPRDNDYIGMLATLTQLSITYFDENGHEFYVIISQ